MNITVPDEVKAADILELANKLNCTVKKDQSGLVLSKKKPGENVRFLRANTSTLQWPKPGIETDSTDDLEDDGGRFYDRVAQKTEKSFLTPEERDIACAARIKAVKRFRQHPFEPCVEIDPIAQIAWAIAQKDSWQNI